MASEFDLIKQYFEPLSVGLDKSETGIGDDGAVLNVPAGHQLVVVTDTLVNGVHFPENTSAYDVGWKALAVNLSDLAAMGATPAFFSLALTLPESDDAWLQGFAQGLADLAKRFVIPLIGGDTTKGPLTVTVTAQGWVEKGAAIMRGNAKQGELVCVTNTIGDAALGLKLAMNTLPENCEALFSDEERVFLLNSLDRPEPQLDFVEFLKNNAGSAIDVSDGLLADLGHIIENSNSCAHDEQISAKLDLEKIPLSQPVRKYIDQTGDWSIVLAGGDDYQLCFTMPEAIYAEACSHASDAGLRLSSIGVVVQGDNGIELYRNGERLEDNSSAGYLHF